MLYQRLCCCWCIIVAAVGYNIRSWKRGGSWRRHVLFSTSAGGGASPDGISNGASAGNAGPDFLQWVREVGIECPKLEVHQFPHGRGLRTTADIAAGEVFFKIPWQICLTAAAASNSNEHQNTPQQIQLAAEWQLQLTLRLLDEFRAGRQSKWFPYISSVLLPLRLELAQSLPVHWSEQLLDVADNVSAALATEAQNAKQWRDYRWAQVTEIERRCQQRGETATNTIATSTTSVTETDSTNLLATSRADFDWAMDCVQTRNCRVIDPSGTTVSALVPFFDLMNHAPQVNSVFFKDEAEGMLCVRYDDHGVLAGEEVCLNYRTVTVTVTDAADTTDTPDCQSLVGAEYELFSYGFCSPALPGSLDFVEVNLPRDAVRAILLADLGACNTDEAAHPRSPSQARAMAVARAARELSIRLGATFRVYEDGIDGHLMMALRLLAFANSNDSALPTADDQYDLEEEVVSSSRYDSSAMELLLAVLDETFSRIAHARDQALTLSSSTTATSSLSMLAEKKINIGQGCKSWAQNYVSTLYK